MKKHSILFIITFLLLVGIFATLNRTQENVNAKNDSLADNINQYITNEPLLNGAIIGISIRNSDNGKIVYEHKGNIRMRPASNLKLLTAAIALNTLGEKYTFETELYTNGKTDGNVLQGNLYIKGKGDPTLLPDDLDKMVKKLTTKGIKVINGDIIADDTWYDDNRYSQDLPWTDEHTYYGAQVSALTLSPDKDYDSGTAIIEIKPGKKIGNKASIHVFPKTDYLKVINKITTGEQTKTKDIDITREHGSNTVIVEGTIPIQASKEKEWVAVWQPTKYVLEQLEVSLKKFNIQITGKTKVKQVPKNAKVLVRDKSIPLSELMTSFLKLSNNGHGETLVKEMGRIRKGKGSWDKGIEVMEEELGKMGIKTGSLVIRDGSGISHVNLIPPNEITKLLFEVQQKNWFPTFKNALPVAGIEERMIGGSLRYRLNAPPLKGNVYAKTGTISTVSTLSGYVDHVNGKNYIFSILINNLIDEDVGKQIEDKIVHILANSP